MKSAQAHCLVCNQPPEPGHRDIFCRPPSPADGVVVGKALAERLARILDTQIEAGTCHARDLCQRCHCTVVEIEGYFRVIADFRRLYQQTAAYYKQNSGQSAARLEPLIDTGLLELEKLLGIDSSFHHQGADAFSSAQTPNNHVTANTNTPPGLSTSDVLLPPGVKPQNAATGTVSVNCTLTAGNSGTSDVTVANLAPPVASSANCTAVNVNDATVNGVLPEEPNTSRDQVNDTKTQTTGDIKIELKNDLCPCKTELKEPFMDIDQSKGGLYNEDSSINACAGVKNERLVKDEPKVEAVSQDAVRTNGDDPPLMGKSESETPAQVETHAASECRTERGPEVDDGVQCADAGSPQSADVTDTMETGAAAVARPSRKRRHNQVDAASPSLSLRRRSVRQASLKPTKWAASPPPEDTNQVECTLTQSSGDNGLTFQNSEPAEKPASAPVRANNSSLSAYSCSTCEAGFKTRHDFYRHIRICGKANQAGIKPGVVAKEDDQGPAGRVSSGVTDNKVTPQQTDTAKQGGLHQVNSETPADKTLSEGASVQMTEEVKKGSEDNKNAGIQGLKDNSSTETDCKQSSHIKPDAKPQCPGNGTQIPIVAKQETSVAEAVAAPQGSEMNGELFPHSDDMPSLKSDPVTTTESVRAPDESTNSNKEAAESSNSNETSLSKDALPSSENETLKENCKDQLPTSNSSCSMTSTPGQITESSSNYVGVVGPPTTLATSNQQIIRTKENSLSKLLDSDDDILKVKTTNGDPQKVSASHSQTLHTSSSPVTLAEIAALQGSVPHSSMGSQGTVPPASMAQGNVPHASMPQGSMMQGLMPQGPKPQGPMPQGPASQGLMHQGPVPPGFPAQDLQMANHTQGFPPFHQPGLRHAGGAGMQRFAQRGAPPPYGHQPGSSQFNPRYPQQGMAPGAPRGPAALNPRVSPQHGFVGPEGHARPNSRPEGYNIPQQPYMQLSPNMLQQQHVAQQPIQQHMPPAHMQENIAGMQQMSQFPNQHMSQTHKQNHTQHLQHHMQHVQPVNQQHVSHQQQNHTHPPHQQPHQSHSHMQHQPGIQHHQHLQQPMPQQNQMHKQQHGGQQHTVQQNAAQQQTAQPHPTHQNVAQVQTSQHQAHQHMPQQQAAQQNQTQKQHQHLTQQQTSPQNQAHPPHQHAKQPQQTQQQHITQQQQLQSHQQHMQMQQQQIQQPSHSPHQHLQQQHKQPHLHMPLSHQQTTQQHQQHMQQQQSQHPSQRQGMQNVQHQQSNLHHMNMPHNAYLQQPQLMQQQMQQAQADYQPVKRQPQQQINKPQENSPGLIPQQQQPQQQHAQHQINQPHQHLPPNQQSVSQQSLPNHQHTQNHQSIQNQQTLANQQHITQPSQAQHRSPQHATGLAMTDSGAASPHTQTQSGNQVVNGPHFPYLDPAFSPPPGPLAGQNSQSSHMYMAQRGQGFPATSPPPSYPQAMVRGAGHHPGMRMPGLQQRFSNQHQAMQGSSNNAGMGLQGQGQGQQNNVGANYPQHSTPQHPQGAGLGAQAGHHAGLQQNIQHSMQQQNMQQPSMPPQNMPQQGMHQQNLQQQSLQQQGMQQQGLQQQNLQQQSLQQQNLQQQSLQQQGMQHQNLQQQGMQQQQGLQQQGLQHQNMQQQGMQQQQTLQQQGLQHQQHQTIQQPNMQQQGIQQQSMQQHNMQQQQNMPQHNMQQQQQGMQQQNLPQNMQQQQGMQQQGMQQQAARHPAVPGLPPVPIDPAPGAPLSLPHQQGFPPNAAGSQQVAPLVGPHQGAPGSAASSHQMAAAGGGDFKPPPQEASFSCASALVNLAKTHTEPGKPLKCLQCDASFFSADMLLEHARVHGGGGGGGGGEAGEACAAGEDADRTSSNATPASSSKDLSPQPSPSPQPKKRKSREPKSWRCSKCNITCENAEDWAEHRRSHMGEKAYPCPTCGVAFAAKWYLTRHQRTHSGEKPHKCDVCGKAFGRPDHLRKHSTIHATKPTTSASSSSSTTTTTANSTTATTSSVSS